MEGQAFQLGKVLIPVEIDPESLSALQDQLKDVAAEFSASVKAAMENKEDESIVSPVKLPDQVEGDKADSKVKLLGEDKDDVRKDEETAVMRKLTETLVELVRDVASRMDRLELALLRRD